MLTLQEVKHIPDYARYTKVIVVLYINGHFWYWGAFNDESKARTVARAIGGKTIQNKFFSKNP